MIATFELALTLKAPILTRSTAIGGFGIDAPAARTSDGRFYLPGTLVLGKIRHALGQLKNVAAAAGQSNVFDPDMDAWFGGGEDGRDEDAKRRRIFVGDLIADDTGQAKATRTRIAIDPIREAASEGALQVLECPWHPGTDVVFRGKVRLRGPSSDIDAFAQQVKKALQWTTQFGGLRSIGFGETVEVALNPRSPAEAAVQPKLESDRMRLALWFDEPFCIVGARSSKNYYRSDDVVPGGVVKGALSTQIGDSGRDYHSLAKNLATLHFGHCFPAALADPDERTHLADTWHADGFSWLTRPSQAPASLVETHGDIADVAFIDGPVLIDDQAPAFMVDWKQSAFSKLTGLTKWVAPGRALRVRTAIDPTELRALSGALFAYDMVETDLHIWVGDIDLGAVPASERQAVREELCEALSSGLTGIGRSAAFADVLFDAPTAGATNPVVELEGDIAAVTLQTPTLLRGSNQNYEEAFDALTNGAMELVRGFWRERLSGADFMANRYFRGRRYQPFLLTEPGSVFVLKLREQEKAEAWLKDALRFGVPLSDPVRSTYEFGAAPEAELWQMCPYLRQNGYGEISCTTAFHRKHAPANFVPVKFAQAGEETVR